MTKQIIHQQSYEREDKTTLQALKAQLEREFDEAGITSFWLRVHGEDALTPELKTKLHRLYRINQRLVYMQCEDLVRKYPKQFTFVDADGE